MEIFEDGMAARLKKYAKRERLFAIVLANDHRKWDAIREIYTTIDIKRFTPYPVDWTRIFSPIESMAWGEIRGCGLPLFPQYPIGRFFADFADPIKKIVLECDGAAYHKDKTRDKARDQFMLSNGYEVFRVSGADCNRVLPTAPELIYDYEEPYWADNEQLVQQVRDWYLSTIDGLILAITNQIYHLYGDQGADRGRELLNQIEREVLTKRRSF